MILEAAIINITRRLDLAAQKEAKEISSFNKLKEEGLRCLISLVESAPITEFIHLIASKDHEILIGYLLNVICQLAKNDRSKQVRILALDLLLSLVDRLAIVHHDMKIQSCSIAPIMMALPGVSSTLFKLITSDTKLPRNFLVKATRCLKKLICITFSSCDHQKRELTDICDNLAIRLSFLFQYVMKNASELHNEVKLEVVNLCYDIVRYTCVKFLKLTLKSLVKFVAFISSVNDPSKNECEFKLLTTLIIDQSRFMIQNCDTEYEKLDILVISSIFEILDDLDQNSMQMLHSERLSQICMLDAFLKFLPSEVMKTLLEMIDKRRQLIKVFKSLTIFSAHQPFLFLTESEVDSLAIENRGQRMYSVDKRFVNLDNSEHNLIKSCWQTIASNGDWFLLNDILEKDLSCLNPFYSDPSTIHNRYLLLKGCLSRAKFISSHKIIQIISSHVDEISELSDHTQNTIGIVILVETIVTLVEIHLRSTNTASDRMMVLRIIICPLLKWASSRKRAISEAAMSGLTQISALYGYDSTRCLITSNIDYIVDGVMQMLDDFFVNGDVVHVLALAFKLSSRYSFHYFKDIYEKVFKLLGIYQHTDRAKLIVLLFLRTLSILSGSSDSVDHVQTDSHKSPLEDPDMLKAIIRELNIDDRLRCLRDATIRAEQIRSRIREMETKLEDEKEIIEDLRLKKIETKEEVGQETKLSPSLDKADRPIEIVFTEKIVKHCIHLMSSNYEEIKILALKTILHGLEILRNDDDTLLPIIHQLWSPLVNRLNNDFRQNLEINLSAFDCLVSIAIVSKDFIKRRTLDSIVPKLCLFLETQSKISSRKKDHGPYCMTMAYKCQQRILSDLGKIAYHIQVGYSCLWRIIKATLLYLDDDQVASLHKVALTSLHYLISLDADCVWYFAKLTGHLDKLPFELIYESETDHK